MVRLLRFAVCSITSVSIVAAATTCNPLSATTCSGDTALATSFIEDFTEESTWFTNISSSGEIDYTSDGLAMTINKRYDAPTLMSTFYIMYGKLEVVLKAANGTGIISSIFLQSDDEDEIDIEWVGGDTTQFQSNYFSKGNTTTYDRGEYHTVTTPQDEFHNYTLDWAMDKTTWYLDGSSVRVLENTTSEGYPQTPMFIKLGPWAGGDPDNAAGTIEWAGGETDYTAAPFTMYVKSLIVTDYSTGSEYTYNGESGTWESIEAEDGEVYARYDQAQVEFAELANGDSISSASTSASASASSNSTTVAATSSTHATTTTTAGSETTVSTTSNARTTTSTASSSLLLTVSTATHSGSSSTSSARSSSTNSVSTSDSEGNLVSSPYIVSLFSLLCMVLAI